MADVSQAQKTAFIQSMLPYALAASKQTGIPPQVFLAINASESNWGNADTLFGIKGSGSAGSKNYSTQEVVNGQNVNTSDNFASYKSPTDAYNAFTSLISSGRYAPAWQNYQKTGDWQALLQGINKAGYATDSNWANMIGSLASTVQSTIQGMPDTALQGTDASGLDPSLFAGLTDNTQLADTIDLLKFLQESRARQVPATPSLAGLLQSLYPNTTEYNPGFNPGGLADMLLGIISGKGAEAGAMLPAEVRRANLVDPKALVGTPESIDYGTPSDLEQTLINQLYSQAQKSKLIPQIKPPSLEGEQGMKADSRNSITPPSFENSAGIQAGAVQPAASSPSLLNMFGLIPPAQQQRNPSMLVNTPVSLLNQFANLLGSITPPMTSQTNPLTKTKELIGKVVP